MTASATRTGTFTLTDARYVGAKIAADLRLLNALYGQPDLARIPDFAEETAVLLNGGYLGTVDFGFMDGGAWKLRLRYTATTGGHLANDRPGSLPAAAAVSGLGFYSYLTYSMKWLLLTAEQRRRFEATLPITRTGAAEPTTAGGTWASGHGYGRNGAGVARDVYIAS